jgi:hypothetical protein
VESWLRCQRLIEVSIQKQPVTPFGSQIVPTTGLLHDS